MAFSILVYGDSLTWGLNPENGERHAEADRWPSVLQTQLGSGARVHAEGLRGRTTIFDEYANGFNKNGAAYLPVVLSTHQPFDLVVLMLGTNDLKPAVCGSVSGIIVGLRRMIGIIRDFPYHQGGRVPQILIVSPPLVCRTGKGEGPGGARSIEESEKMAPAIRALCADEGCRFLDAAPVARSSPVDGVHLDAANTRAIGLAVARAVRDPIAAAPKGNTPHPRLKP